jgi:hypothetical protein
MLRILFIIFIPVLLIACGTQRQLKHAYTGKPVAILHDRFGTPEIVLDEGSDTVYIFQNTEDLRSTEISQGKMTLDPIVSPKAKKTERYYFTIKNGIITDARLEEEYER